MVLASRVRVGIVLHAAVNVAFAGVALATDEAAGPAGTGTGTGAVAVAAVARVSVVGAAVESPPAVVAVRPTTTTVTTPRPPVASTRQRGGGSAAGTRVVTSTGYCLDGITASGAEVGPGQAAMNDVPLGTHVQILDGPLAGTRFVVTDRIGHGTELDVWFDDCDDAVAYGRRRVTIRTSGGVGATP